jgi:hypothetical protein
MELGFPQSVYEKEMARAIKYGGVWDRLCNRFRLASPASCSCGDSPPHWDRCRAQRWSILSLER